MRTDAHRFTLPLARVGPSVVTTLSAGVMVGNVLADRGPASFVDDSIWRGGETLRLNVSVTCIDAPVCTGVPCLETLADAEFDDAFDASADDVAGDCAVDASSALDRVPERGCASFDRTARAPSAVAPGVAIP
ncbi:hypothetical protein WS83_27770 [Burkholderia sp. MSMB2042]|nr:hypothetical protein WS77_20455 [Burkholderia sp. MSMB0265]KVG98810.1 hypothetical protein WS83_27770 [Burkholderia sp. MSMB2042]KVG98990.1 hypothetical protein WS82_25650 [Burkholderia sp. MSMB2041]